MDGLMKGWVNGRRRRKKRGREAGRLKCMPVDH
jgi:hypothetical protein